MKICIFLALKFISLSIGIDELGCDSLQNASKMFVEYGTESRLGLSLAPIARCTCSESEGEFLYWTPSKYGELLASNAYRDEVYCMENFAFVIQPDSEHKCQNFCMCTDGKECYQPSNNSNFRVEFLPYCENPNQCVMYVAVHRNFSLFINDNGTIVDLPEMLNSTKKSEYLAILSIGCNGCSQLKDIQNCQSFIEHDPICLETRLSIGLTLDSSVVSYTSFAEDFIPPMHGCDCDNGTRFYYQTNYLFENGKYGPLNDLLSGPEALKVALAITSLDHCLDMCICTKTMECYQSFRYSEVHFIPFCNLEYCNMFAVVYPSEIYGQLSYLNGTIYKSPNPNDPDIDLAILDQASLERRNPTKYAQIKESMKIYIHADSVSCAGCAPLLKNTCTTNQAPACISPNNTVSLTVIGDTLPSNVDEIVMPIGSCFCTHGRRYTWAPVKNNMPANSQPAFIIRSGLNYDDELWCICDEDGTCYTPSNPTEFLIHFYPYCEDSDCHMYAVVQDNSYDINLVGRPIIFLNSTFVIGPNSNVVPLGTNSGYIKVGSIARSHQKSCVKMATGLCIGPWSQIDPGDITLFPVRPMNNNKTSSEHLDVIYDAATRLQQLNKNTLLSEMKPLDLFTLFKQECEMRYTNLTLVITCIEFNLNSLNIVGTKYIEYYYPSEMKIQQNVITNLAFTSIGLVSSFGLIILISKNSTLRTSFGILCLLQAINEIIIFCLFGIVDGVQNIRFLSHGDYNIYIFGIILNVYVIQYISKTLCLILEIIKPMSRFIFHYFPAACLRFKAKHTNFAMAIPITIICFFSLPLVDDACKVVYEEKTNGITVTATNDCFQFYLNAHGYLEIATIVLSAFFILSIIYTLYRMQRNKNNSALNKPFEEKQLKVELVYFVQNFISLIYLMIYSLLSLIFGRFTPGILSENLTTTSFSLNNNSITTQQNNTLANLSNEESMIENGSYSFLRFLYETNCALIIWRCITAMTSVVAQIYLSKK